MLFRNAIADWCAYRERMSGLRMVARSTLENQTAIAVQLAGALGDHDLSDLRKSHIELWMGERLRTCAPITVRGEMNVLRQIINWCVDEQLLAVKPRLPKLSVPTVEAPLPSDEAFLWVLANVPANHATALEFMMLTGVSPHELERIEKRDAGLTDLGGVIGSGIGIGMRPDFPVKQASRRRKVPLNGRAEVLWFEAAGGKAPHQQVFPTVAAMQKAIRRATVLSGIGGTPRRLGPLGAEQITPKLMRKWFASKVSNEQPEHVLQRLMGHAPGSPITRRHYVRSTDDQLAGAVERISA